MKKILTNLILVAAFLYGMNADGQTNVYHPFPFSNATWRVDFFTGAMVTTSTLCFSCYKCQYQISGDTIIGGCNYHKIMKTGSDYNYDGNLGCNFNMPTCIENQYMGALREDLITRKVYFINGSITDTILYDFTLNVGDTLHVGFNNHCFYNDTISSIDSVLIGTHYRKRWNYNIGGCGMPSSIIEGIGSTHGLLEELYSFESGGDLICFSQNDTTYYPNYNTSGNCDLITVGINEILNKEDPISIFPNPATDLLTISLPATNIKSCILNLYDMLGEKMLPTHTLNLKLETLNISSLPQGIYFLEVMMDNEKVVRKVVKM